LAVQACRPSSLTAIQCGFSDTTKDAASWPVAVSITCTRASSCSGTWSSRPSGDVSGT
jgi:hypothetical protein